MTDAAIRSIYSMHSVAMGGVYNHSQTDEWRVWGHLCLTLYVHEFPIYMYMLSWNNCFQPWICFKQNFILQYNTRTKLKFINVQCIGYHVLTKKSKSKMSYTLSIVSNVPGSILCIKLFSVATTMSSPMGYRLTLQLSVLSLFGERIWKVAIILQKWTEIVHY